MYHAHSCTGAALSQDTPSCSMRMFLLSNNDCSVAPTCAAALLQMVSRQTQNCHVGMLQIEFPSADSTTRPLYQGSERIRISDVFYVVIVKNNKKRDTRIVVSYQFSATNCFASLIVSYGPIPKYSKLSLRCHLARVNLHCTIDA